MEQEKIRTFDTAKFLDSEEKITSYLNTVISDSGLDAKEDLKCLLSALGDVARARNINKISRETGISRAGIYKALSAEGNPSFFTISKILKSLDVELCFTSKRHDNKNRQERISL